MSKYQVHIVSDPRILLGKPVIKGKRIYVEFILKKLSEGATLPDLAGKHKLSLDAIYAALDYGCE